MSTEVRAEQAEDSERIGGPMDVDDLIVGLSEERKIVAFKRAERAFNDCVADYQGDAFTDEYADQLKRLIAEDFIEDFKDKGLISACVNEEGEHAFTLTDLGKRVLEKSA